MEYSIHAVDMASRVIGRNPVSARGRWSRSFLDDPSAGVPGDVSDVWTVEYDFGDTAGLKA